MEDDHDEEYIVRGKQRLLNEIQGLGVPPLDGSPFIKGESCNCTSGWSADWAPSEPRWPHCATRSLHLLSMVSLTLSSMPHFHVVCNCVCAVCALPLRADSLRQIMIILFSGKPTERVEKRSLYRLLGEVELLQKYLLPLLVSYRDDPLVVFDVGASTRTRSMLLLYCHAPVAQNQTHPRTLTTHSSPR